jgi:predicted molibdopterin-dependent oxidoreductase YjgC
MGAYATAFPGGKPVDAENAKWLSSEYGFPVPSENGLTACEMVEACARGELDLLYCLGGNFLRTLPDPDYVAKAMRNVPLRVHQDIILTDQMFIEPGEEVLLLPAKTRYEQDDGGTETTTERRVILSPEIPRQVGETRAEWRILRELAVATFPERAHLLGCENGQQIRDEIARVVPFYDGIQRLKKGGDQFQYGGAHLCADGKFATTDGKGHFRVVHLPNVAERGVLTAPCHDDGHARRAGDSEACQFTVSTRRGKQFNTLIYAEVDPLNGAARNSVLMNPEDAAALHVRSNDRITLVSRAGRFEGRVFLAPIARGNLQIHWPEGNIIIPRGLHDTLGGVPDYNATVTVEAAARHSG